MRFPLTLETLRRSEKLVETLSGREREVETYDGFLEVALSGCRDVTRVLEKEIEMNVPELRSWYEARAREMGLPRNSAVLWLREARNLSTERNGPSVKPTASFGAVRAAKLPAGEAIAVTHRGELMRITKDERGRESRQRVSELDDGTVSMQRIVRPEPPQPLLLEGQDISGLGATDTLREYVGFLRRLVESAESARA